jgi:GDP-mannose transporter
MLDGSNTPSEKERIKAEMEAHAALLKQDDVVEKAKKDEVGVPAASPGE